MHQPAPVLVGPFTRVSPEAISAEPASKALVCSEVEIANWDLDAGNILPDQHL